MGKNSNYLKKKGFSFCKFIFLIIIPACVFAYVFTMGDIHFNPKIVKEWEECFSAQKKYEEALLSYKNIKKYENVTDDETFTQLDNELVIQASLFQVTEMLKS